MHTGTAMKKRTQKRSRPPCAKVRPVKKTREESGKTFECQGSPKKYKAVTNKTNNNINDMNTKSNIKPMEATPKLDLRSFMKVANKKSTTPIRKERIT